jgi:hypothetical protein
MLKRVSERISLGCRAYDRAVIQVNGKDAATNFDLSRYDTAGDRLVDQPRTPGESSVHAFFFTSFCPYLESVLLNQTSSVLERIEARRYQSCHCLENETSSCKRHSLSLTILCKQFTSSY